MLMLDLSTSASVFSVVSSCKTHELGLCMSSCILGLCIVKLNEGKPETGLVILLRMGNDSRNQDEKVILSPPIPTPMTPLLSQ